MTSASRGSFLQLVKFVVDGTCYAVQLSATERALPMVAVSAVPGAPLVVLGAVNIAGEVVPVVDIRRRLGLAPRTYGLGAHLLLVRTSRRRLAVAADEVGGVAHVEAGSVAHGQTVIPGLGPIAGIAALPDGLLFIHDIEGFLTQDEERQLGQALDGAES